MRLDCLIAGALALLLGACAPVSQDKPRFLWIDAPANFSSYAGDADSIATDCRRIARMGFTDIVVDVRPTSGDVLFRSKVAPPLRHLPAWINGKVGLRERKAGFDYLQAFIDAGHAAGLKVHAGVNMMVGGWRMGRDFVTGMVFDHPERKAWCAVDLLPDGTLRSQADNPSVRGGCFLDPANPEVQAFLLSMLEDLASYRELDGIVMDRCRYDDYAMDAGYTEAGRRAFAEFLGREPERWPVFTEPGHIFLDKEPDELEVQWLTFRCRVIHDFVARAAERVHAVRPSLHFGIYVGAWFSEYYRSGVNWTSPRYDLAAEEPTYAWATPEYQATGLADLVDFMLLGTYCPAANVHGDTEKTMEGYARLARKRLCGDVPFYGGPDIGNEKGFEKGGKGYLLPEIRQTLLREADGFFLFDLCHIRAFDYWDAFEPDDAPLYDVVVVGGGTGGTAAAIEAARGGVSVLVVEETPWLGGMLTSAGVSAIDGNYRLRGGLFGEFTDSLSARYGGYEALKSGWVSNILFNPAVGAEVLRNMAAGAGVEVLHGVSVTDIQGHWALSLSDGSRVRARVLIDGTELGDVAAWVGAEALQDRISTQDFTYVAVVREYDHPVLIPEPEGYDRELYRSCCDNPLADNQDGHNPLGQQLWSPEMMLSYGRLPDGHIMLNWPVCANDYYAEYLDMTPAERSGVIRSAKLRTLGYLYFLQHELGYENLGIADDVFPTEDGLPFFPYWREARRIAGRDTMTVEAARRPYDFDLYTRAVAVGDYPVDHHHVQNPRREELSHLWFGKIPSFSVPLGVVVPARVEDLLVADKAVSVSWEMNGATRLQPVVMGMGQAAGALAALSVRSGRHPSEVPAAEVQSVLLDHGCYLLPFLDLKPAEPGFRALQEAGVRGEVRGTGRSVGWSNETWVKLPENEK